MRRYLIDTETGEVHHGFPEHDVDERNLTPASFHWSISDALEWVRGLHDSGQGLSRVRPTACLECFDP